MRLVARLLGLALLAAVIAVAGACGSAPAPASGGAFVMKDLAFSPQQISIANGTTVSWTNQDTTTHTVTSGTPGGKTGKFDGSVDAGKAFTFTFTDAGTYEFFCSIHTTMKGTVSVR